MGTSTMSRVDALEALLTLESAFPGISEQSHWLNQGLEVSESFVAHPEVILGRCNDIARSNFFTEDARRYLEQKHQLKQLLSIPESLAMQADGVLIEVEFALPASFRLLSGAPNKKGQQRIDGMIKCLPKDWDNIGKPICDAIFAVTETVSDHLIKVKDSWLKKDGTFTKSGAIEFNKARTRTTVKDANLMIGQVQKRWGLENKITIRLLMPILPTSAGF